MARRQWPDQSGHFGGKADRCLRREKAQQAEQQNFYAEAGIGLLQAEQARVRSREQLTRLLGLWGEQLD